MSTFHPTTPPNRQMLLRNNADGNKYVATALIQIAFTHTECLHPITDIYYLFRSQIYSSASAKIEQNPPKPNPQSIPQRKRQPYCIPGPAEAPSLRRDAGLRSLACWGSHCYIGDDPGRVWRVELDAVGEPPIKCLTVPPVRAGQPPAPLPGSHRQFIDHPR
jgi:hypothetical protein